MIRMSRRARLARNIIFRLRPAATLACGVILATAALAPAAAAAPGDSRLRRAAAEWSHDGLRRTQVPGLDLVYVREGASLAGYDKVWLRSVDVAFRRDWRPAARPGSRLVDADVARIKDGLARILRDEAGRELARGGYALVDGAATGVLAVDVSIVDLYINAPDVPGGPPVQRYTLSVGEMTLQADLRDAPSGETLARVLDRREGRDLGEFQLTTAVDNAGEARDAVRAWARILRQRLDAARGLR